MAEIQKVERPEYVERPKYRILDVSGFFGPDDTLYPEGSEIYFDGVPNAEMEPLNESARLKLVSELDRLDNLARQTAEKLGKPFIGRPRNLDGALAIATEVQRMNMSVMGTKEKDVSTIEPIHRPDVPDMANNQAKRGRGRPKKLVEAA